MAEDILHFGAYKIRVNGVGVLRSTLKGLDNVNTQTLANLTMSTTPGREPTILSNFTSQRARLRLETTAINETFNINRIIFYVKPLWASFPQ